MNEANDEKIRPLLNEIVDNVFDVYDENGICYRKLLQYIILTNYMGDPTSPTCIRQTSGM